jgi:hypothetical protein
MKIIGFIYKRTVLKKILKHLNEYNERMNQRVPPAALPEYIERVEIISYDDGWPDYEDRDYGMYGLNG